MRDVCPWEIVGAEIRGGGPVTVLWFVIWLISDHVGGHESLLFDPVNVWTATLLAAIALDLGRHHARSGRHR